MKNVITLIIVDGYGICGSGAGIPGCDSEELSGLMSKYPHTALSLPGRDNAVYNNSGRTEIGYLLIGAGREILPDIPYGLENTFGEYISSLGLTTTRIYSGTDSTAATYFFSGKNKALFPRELRVSAAAPNDTEPGEMLFEIVSEIARSYEKTIAHGESDVIIVSIPICNAASKSGVPGFIERAVASADACIARIVGLTSKYGGITFITSSHAAGGNDCRVPLLVVGADISLSAGRLSDVAPTMLDIMGLSRPDEMTGKSLISER